MKFKANFVPFLKAHFKVLKTFSNCVIFRHFHKKLFSQEKFVIKIEHLDYNGVNSKNNFETNLKLV